MSVCTVIIFEEYLKFHGDHLNSSRATDILMSLVTVGPMTHCEGEGSTVRYSTGVRKKM